MFTWCCLLSVYLSTYLCVYIPADASLKRGKAASQDDETGGLGQLVLEALACFPMYGNFTLGFLL